MSLVFVATIVLTQVASGSVLVLLLTGARIRSGYGVAGIGLAVGTFISMLSAVLLNGTALSAIAWLIPGLVITAGCLMRTKSIRNSFTLLRFERNESVAVALGIAAGLLLLIINWIRFPLSSVRAGSSVDMYFLEALSRGVGEFGAQESILMSGGSLRYHWFTYGWAGELAQTAGLTSFVSLTRVLPVVALIGSVLIATAWANSIRITRGKSLWWVPSLAVLLIVIGGYTGALYGVILNNDSPSQSLTTVWLLALVVLFLVTIKTQTWKGFSASAILVVVLAFATTGGKASHVAVALGGFGIVALGGMLFKTTWWRKALLLGFMAFVAAVAAYMWVLSGVGIEENLTEALAVRASTWQVLDPVTGRWGPAMGTLALLLAVLARLSGSWWLLTTKTGRRSPEIFFAVGSVLVGVAALFFLREGINELWFLLAASAPVAVISAYGVGQGASAIFKSTERKRTWLYVLYASVFASLISLTLSFNWKFTGTEVGFFQWPGVLFWLSIMSVWLVIPVLGFMFIRISGKSSQKIEPKRFALWFVFCVGALTLTSIFTRPAVLWTESRELNTEIGIVSPNPEVATSTTQSSASLEGKSLLTNHFAAAQWLVDNSLRSQVVASSDPQSSFIPAISGNQMFLAGERYQYGLGKTSEQSEILNRSQLSTQLQGKITFEVLDQFCLQNVSYLWIEGDLDLTLLPENALHVFGSVGIIGLQDYCSIK